MLIPINVVSGIRLGRRRQDHFEIPLVVLIEGGPSPARGFLILYCPLYQDLVGVAVALCHLWLS